MTGDPSSPEHRSVPETPSTEASRVELATRAVHDVSGTSSGDGAGDLPERRPGAPVAPPLVLSSTFHSGGPDDGGRVLYGREGGNPTLQRVGRRVASLEGMEEGLVVGSGMAAISVTCLSLLRAGDHLVTSRYLYGTTRIFMTEELPARGIEVSWVDPDREGAWEAAVRRRTRLLYLEMPTNPTLRVFDPRPVAAVARRAGIPLVMDVTFATPVNLRAGELGADLVVHSATKYLGGHSDLVGGAVAGARPLVDGVARMVRLYGPVLDPHAAWLLDRGLRTLDVRVERHNRNAMELARWFGEQPQVERVIYPGLEDHPDHRCAAEIVGGFGGMLGVVVGGGTAGAEAFCRGLRLAAVAPSLGGVETLVSLPSLTSHRGLTPEERAAAGIPGGFVRISVGIEGLDDLKTDFRRALRGAAASAPDAG